MRRLALALIGSLLAVSAVAGIGSPAEARTPPGGFGWPSPSK